MLFQIEIVATLWHFSSFRLFCQKDPRFCLPNFYQFLTDVKSYGGNKAFIIIRVIFLVTFIAPAAYTLSAAYTEPYL